MAIQQDKQKEKRMGQAEDTLVESALLQAKWSYLANNIDKVLKEQGERKNAVPKRIALGTPAERDSKGDWKENAGKPAHMFEWCSFRGLNICSSDAIVRNKKDVPMSDVRKIASAMLARILLSAGSDSVLIRKVDPKGLGKDLAMIPAQPKAPVIVDRESLSKLLTEFKKRIANYPVIPPACCCQ